MWTYNKEDLVQEVNTGGNYLEKSGAYNVIIKEVTFKDTSGGAKAVNFKVETLSGQSTTLFINYADKEQAPIQFLVARLNQLCGLLKVTPEKLAENAINREIGLFLKAKLSSDGKYVNFDLEGVYDAKTKLTTKEISEKVKTPEVYEKMVEKYSKETPLERNSGNGSAKATTTASTNTVSKAVADSDSFPF